MYGEANYYLGELRNSVSKFFIKYIVASYKFVIPLQSSYIEILQPNFLIIMTPIPPQPMSHT